MVKDKSEIPVVFIPSVSIKGKLMIAEVQPVENTGNGTTKDKRLEDTFIVILKGVFSSGNMASILAMSKGHMVDVTIGSEDDGL